MGNQSLPKATKFDEFISILFNIIDLLTRVFGLFGVITDYTANA